MIAFMKARSSPWVMSLRCSLHAPKGTRTCLAVLLCLFGSAGPAFAASAPAPAPKPPNPLIETIENLYQKASFEEALMVLETAARAPDNDDRDRERLAVLEGVLQAELLKEDVAREAFARALELNPEASLPDYVPPKTVKLFEEMRRAEAAIIRPPPPPPPTPATPEEMAPHPRVVVLGNSEPPWLLANRQLAWIPIGVGGAAAAGGITLAVVSHGINGALRAGDSTIRSPDELDLALYRGRTFQATGWMLIGAGGALVAGGLAWHFAPDLQGLFVSAAPTPGGMFATLSGSLP